MEMTLVEQLDVPTKSGIWLVVRYLNKQPEEVCLKSVLNLNGVLHVRAYVSSNQTFSFLTAPVKVQDYNRPDYKWILLQEDLVEQLKKQLL